MDLPQYLKRRQRWVNDGLKRWVPAINEFPPQIHEAVHYSLFAGGKRLRPILALAGAEAVGGRARDALPLACALELIHTYSLIHDDLPAMDNDDLRRGKPTSHRVFGEALAILAGDALLTEAFRLMARTDLMTRVPLQRILRAMGQVAQAAGPQGMVGGQALDILTQGEKIDAPLLEYIHSHKTGALITAAVCGGAIIGGGSEREIKALRGYGEKLGLAFQVIDDLLDVQGKKGRMGKGVGKDQSQGKATYPALYGATGSRRMAEEFIAEALAWIASFSRRANPLREMAHFVLSRKS